MYNVNISLKKYSKCEQLLKLPHITDIFIKIMCILGLFFELRVTLPRQYGLDISGETLQQLLMRNN